MGPAAMQKDSELTFKADRPIGDPNKLPDYEHALAELKAAHVLFSQLAEMDRRHNPIDKKKLQTHKQYCDQAYSQAQVSCSTVSCERCCLLWRSLQYLLTSSVTSKCCEQEQLRCTFLLFRQPNSEGGANTSRVRVCTQQGPCITANNS